MPGHHSSAGLQRLPLLGADEPPWLALSCQDDVPNNNSPSPECKQAASPTVEVCQSPEADKQQCRDQRQRDQVGDTTIDYDKNIVPIEPSLESDDQSRQRGQAQDMTDDKITVPIQPSLDTDDPSNQ